MDSKPVFRVGAAGLDPRDWRLIEIVFKHSQYNKFEFRLIPDLAADPIDVLIVNSIEPEGLQALMRARSSERHIPVIAAVPRGAPSAAKHAISIDRLTLQLLPILNRVVELALLAESEGKAGTQPPAGGARTSALGAQTPAFGVPAPAFDAQVPSAGTTGAVDAVRPVAGLVGRASGAPEPAVGVGSLATSASGPMTFGNATGPTGVSATDASTPPGAASFERARPPLSPDRRSAPATMGPAGRVSDPVSTASVAGRPAGPAPVRAETGSSSTPVVSPGDAAPAPDAPRLSAQPQPQPQPPAAAPAPSNLVAFPRSHLAEGANNARLRVLIVDDSPTVRRQLSGALERLGVASESVESARQALQRLSEQHFDLALLDIVMPDMDGYKLTREIKRNKQWRQLPVIILTSRSSPFDLARGALAGCDAYLTKPVPFRALEAAIVKQLRRSLAIDDLSGLIRPSVPAAPTAPAKPSESRLARLFGR